MQPVAQGSVHHAYVSLFLLVFVFLVKVPDIFYTRLCLPEFESLIGQITVELRRVAAFVEGKSGRRPIELALYSDFITLVYALKLALIGIYLWQI